NTLLPFIWSNGKTNSGPGVNASYTLYFDNPSGDFSMPLDNITNACCAASFADSSLLFSQDDWAGFLNGIYQTKYGRDFLIGDSLILKWRVNLSVVAPGPVMDNRDASQDLEVTFVRGQFSDEYTPV